AGGTHALAPDERDPAGDQPLAERGDRALPVHRLRRVRAVQRRGPLAALVPEAARAVAMTRVPRRGENVTLRRATRSGRREAAVRFQRRITSPSTIRISISANDAPRQRRI